MVDLKRKSKFKPLLKIILLFVLIIIFCYLIFNYRAIKNNRKIVIDNYIGSTFESKDSNLKFTFSSSNKASYSYNPLFSDDLEFHSFDYDYSEGVVNLKVDETTTYHLVFLESNKMLFLKYNKVVYLKK